MGSLVIASGIRTEFIMPRSEQACAYCGTVCVKAEREHVVPSCLYPRTKRVPGLQLLTVPACSTCNHSWEDDEAHFRNVIVISGDATPSARELWETKALPSFDYADGRRRLEDLFSLLVPTETPGGPRQMIFPARDERVLRVVRKSIRGLSHHHKLSTAIPDERVVVTHHREIPAEFTELMTSRHRDPEVFEYGYAVIDTEEIESIWEITYLGRTKFLGAVLTRPLDP